MFTSVKYHLVASRVGGRHAEGEVRVEVESVVVVFLYAVGRQHLPVCIHHGVSPRIPVMPRCLGSLIFGENLITLRNSLVHSAEHNTKHSYCEILALKSCKTVLRIMRNEDTRLGGMVARLHSYVHTWRGIDMKS